MEDGVLPGLADDEIGPLDHHDGNKEGGVAGVLEDLTVPRRKEGGEAGVPYTIKREKSVMVLEKLGKFQRRFPEVSGVGMEGKKYICMCPLLSVAVLKVVDVQCL